MSAMLDYMQLCRLCLVKEKVNVPIFGDENDVEQIFLKITACLPVKVAQEDNLPKKICDSCLYKVDLLYQFWNTTVNAEKQLIQWLTEIGVDVNIKNSDTQTLPILPQSHAHPHSMPLPIPVVVADLKQERPDIVEKQPGFQMPEQPNLYSGFDNLGYPQAEVTMEVGAANTFVQPEPVEEPPPPDPPAPTPKKRGRPAGTTNKKSPPKKKPTPAPPVVVSSRTNSTRRSSATAAAAAVAAAAAAATDSEEDSDGDRLGGMDYDDSDSDEDHITKEEFDSDEDYVKPKSFIGVPSSADGEQPGPSGLGGVKGEAAGANATESGQAYNEATYMERDNYPCSSLPDLEEHTKKPLKISIKKNLGKYQCERCNQSFYTLVNFVQHRKVFHNLECENCFQVFKDSSTLIQHLSVSHGVHGGFKCHICNDTFATSIDLFEHKELHETVTSFKCDICGEQLDTREKLKLHKLCHIVPNLQCNFCKKQFKCHRLLVRHQKKVHYKDYQVSCTKCTLKFISNEALEQHLKFHHKPVRYLESNDCGQENLIQNEDETNSCEIQTKYNLENKLDENIVSIESNSEQKITNTSNETFTTGSSLLRLALLKQSSETNEKIVNTTNTNSATEDYLKDYILYNQNDDSNKTDEIIEEHVCDICGKKYKTKKVLRQHKLDHAISKRVECNLCCKTFKTLRNLQQHKKLHFSQYSFFCPDCRHGFFSRTSLEEHHNVVHKGLRIQCELCDKTFGSKNALLKHSIVHKPVVKIGNVEMYPCTLCEKSYESKQVLRHHIRRHSFRPVFICDVCGKILTSHTSLRDHKNAHTGIKPYTCNYCKKAFTTKSQLKTHEFIHTKEKPFACKHCNKRFTQRGTLTIHLRYHTGEKPYSCHICKKRFVAKTLMKSHAKIHGVALADIKTD